MVFCQEENQVKYILISDINAWAPTKKVNILRNAIVKDARKAIVYPNKIYVPTSSSEDPMIVRCLDPTGIMAVKVNSGSGLPTKGKQAPLQENESNSIKFKIFSL